MYRQDAINDTLTACLIATGLANYAIRTKSSQMMGLARKKHAAALHKLNTALKHPTVALKDTILVSIMVLGVFEALAGLGQLSLKGWIEHINGCMAMLKLRGRAQLSNPVSIEIFIHVSGHLQLSCMQREVPMDPKLVSMAQRTSRQVGRCLS